MNERELLKRLVELKDQKDRIDRAMRSDDFRERDYAGVEYHERYKPAKDAAWAEARALLAQPERKPQWSDQPPTAPGWYWYRTQSTDEPHIIEGSQDGERMEWYLGDALMYAELRGQWAGPITPPEE